MGGGLILGMDHDCPWVGGPIGHGNSVPVHSNPLTLTLTLTLEP